MKNSRNWMLWVVAVSMVGVMELKAEEAVPAVQKDAPDAARMEAQKKHESEEQQKRLEQVKKQIAERQAAIEKMTKMLAENKDDGMRSYNEKQLEFARKQLSLLQEMQTALEARDKERMAKIYAQMQELNSTRNGSGEMVARMEAERALVKKNLGETPSPEMKTAFESYNAACDGMLIVLEKRQALEKEFKELSAKQRAALEELQKTVRASRQKGKEGAQ